MPLNDDDIRSFMVAYEKSFKKPIDFDAARIMATNFMTVLMYVSRVPPSKRAKKIKQGLDALIRDNRNNVYFRWLRDVESYITLGNAIEFGLLSLKETALPDMPLSDYFMALSDIDELPDTVRDFLVDMSVWCEGPEDFGYGFTPANAAARYEREVRPLV